MKITVRVSKEVSYDVVIKDDYSYDELIDAIKNESPEGFEMPQDFKLVHNGERLDPEDAKLTDESIVILMSNNEVPKKKKSKKKCSFGNCSNNYLRMVGDCHHCNGRYCAKHRLLEDHICSGLQYCKDNAHEQNAMKLQNERTISSRV